MTEPATPTPKVPSLKQRAVQAAVWCLSPTGRKDLGAVIAAVTAVYTALHRAGV